MNESRMSMSGTIDQWKSSIERKYDASYKKAKFGGEMIAFVKVNTTEVEVGRYLPAKKSGDILDKKNPLRESVEMMSEAYTTYTDKGYEGWGEDKAIGYGLKHGYKPVAVIGLTAVHVLVLFPMNSHDKKIAQGQKLKAGEQIYRYSSEKTAKMDMFPLIKVNLDKGMVYFLSEETAQGTTDELKFETRNIKLKYSRVINR